MPGSTAQAGRGKRKRPVGVEAPEKAAKVNTGKGKGDHFWGNIDKWLEHLFKTMGPDQSNGNWRL